VVLRDQVVWLPRPPRRAAVRLGLLTLAAVPTLAAAHLIVGDEPTRLESGRLNPLFLSFPALIAAFVIAAVPSVLALIRRPHVAADHFALRLRPGCLRTLVVPWAQVAELAAVPVRTTPRRWESLMLVRFAWRRGGDGDRPQFWDTRLLRDARRAGGRDQVDGYHLAVRLGDFAGTPYNLLSALAVFAPGHVLLVSKLEDF
jgi:hypothetical protein